jgi:hypothetical protein
VQSQKNSTSPLSEEARKERKRLRDRARYQAKRKDIIAQNKAYGQRNKHKRKGYVLKTRYGITQEDWERLFDEQGRVCGICSSSAHSDHRDWHTDHDHATGEVRGILCARCNHLLGHARDNVTTLSNAIEYLKKHGQEA